MSRKSDKSGRDVRSGKDEGKAGYCQVCGAYFNDLAGHAKSCRHGSYPPIQYPQLESIFNYCDLEDMGCLKKTLKIVKSPPSEIFEKPSLELPVVTMNGHHPRSNISKSALYNGFFSSDRSNYDKSDASQDEDEDDDFFSKDESSDEEESKRKKYHSRKPKNSAQARRSRISRKRLSVEEKLIEDNKSYYRVEVLNSKLRSSEYFVNQKQLESRVSEEIENDSCSDEGECSREAQPLSKNVEKSKEPVVVRFKKVRKSQLSVLSDEAENFMFGDSARREAKKIEYTSPDESSDTGNSETSSSEDEELPKIKKMVRDSDEESPPNRDIDSDSLSSPPTLTCDHDSVSESEEETVTKNCADPDFTLGSITFSFENPPKNEPWIETCKRLEDGTNEYHYPYHHNYPKVVLPFEYPVSERLKLLSGRRGQGFGRRRGRRKVDDCRARKSPRCHASTLAVMSNFLRRPLRECSKSSVDFSYEEESRSSLPDTVETSSSTSEYRMSSYMSNSDSLPIDPNGDVFAAALARVACGETSTLQVSPGPCLAVNPALMNNPPGMDIYLKPGPIVPLEAIINQYNTDTSWMEYMDYSSAYHEPMPDPVTCYQLQNTEVNNKAYIKNEPYNWPELPLRRRRKRVKKENEPRPVVPPVHIKCEPCEIKLEPMPARILEHFAVKDEPVLIKEDSISVGGNIGRFHCIREQGTTAIAPPPPVIKRGRGRPRKNPLPPAYQSPSGFTPSSQTPPATTFPNKSTFQEHSKIFVYSEIFYQPNCIV